MCGSLRIRHLLLLLKVRLLWSIMMLFEVWNEYLVQSACVGAFAGIMAFHITNGQNRFIGCYIDGSRAVFESAGLSGNVWSHGFECCAGSGLNNVPHGIELLGDAVGPGLIITHNIFRGGSIFSTPSTNGTAVGVTGTLIADNSFSGRGAGTRVTQTISVVNTSSVDFNFCSSLVFPTISRVSASAIISAGFPVLVARLPVGCTVTVEISEALTGSVSVTVDSSSLSTDFI
jgi:hypothetical protein